MFSPPLEFTQVAAGVYRGAYPREINVGFLATLALDTVVSLTPEPVPEDSAVGRFAAANGIRLVHVKTDKAGKGKKRGVGLSREAVEQAMEEAARGRVYIHCLNGGQVTSLVVACMRVVSGWSAVLVGNEFVRMTGGIGVEEREFIEGFRGALAEGGRGAVAAGCPDAGMACAAGFGSAGLRT